MSTVLAALPSSVQGRAAHAIAETFPNGHVQAVQPLQGGLSGALVYQLVVDGQQFVLRIMQATSLLQDPARQLACTQIASAQGITPHVSCASVELALSISAYVPSQPALPALRRDIDLVAQFGGLMRRLHGGPAFPVFLDTLQMIAGGLEQLATIGVALPGVLQELLAAFVPVKQALQPHWTLAPCHNDLNPGNVLHDGQRLWLIDWEGACMNDPMFDLATLIHWFLFDARQEATLLHAYFQRAPTAHELAKLEIMKQVSWVFYALVFQLVSVQEQGAHAAVAPNDDVHVPSFAEMLAAIGKGDIQLHNADTRRLMSLVMAKQALNEMRRPTFNQSLASLG